MKIVLLLKKLLFLASICICCSLNLKAFSPPIPITLLDVSIRNSETDDAEVCSARHALKVCGTPFSETTSILTALQSKIIVVSSKMEPFTFSSAEKDSLVSFVRKGGILICPNVRDPFMHTLFGLSGGTNANNLYSITFNTFLNDPVFRWLDDSLEKTISLGSSTFTSVINSRYYTPTTALSLAKYNNTKDAITCNTFSVGYAYAIGVSFKNIILLNQQNRDFNANRYYSNDFEPTSDAFILFLKGIILKHLPVIPYLHTSLFNSKASVLITHDVDATSAFDTMSHYSLYEQSIGIKASYYITTHYINDGALSDFYNVFTIPKVNQLLTNGHILGSHSVGHFIDFADESVFPLGTPGNTPSNYLPYNHGNSSPTLNGTVFGETEVSRDLLNTNFGIQIKTFRPGYLAFNNKLINALELLNYKFSSSVSANDVLTNFPYQCKKDNTSYGSLSKIWEIPMTISDAAASDPITPANYPQKVLKWLSVVQKNKNNTAPTTLLIHPNRLYKLAAQRDFISGLSSDIMVTNLEAYGEFWQQRDSLNFSFTLRNDSLSIIIPNQQLPLPPAISFIVNNGQQLSHISLKSEGGSNIPVIQGNWEQNDKILYFQNAPVVGLNEWIYSPNRSLLVYPNPCTDKSVISTGSNIYQKINCELYTLGGELIEQICAESTDHVIIEKRNYQGLYCVKLYGDGIYLGTTKLLFKDRY